MEEVKKRILLLLTTFICISHCACVGSESTSGGDTGTKTENSSENNPEAKTEGNCDFQRAKTEEGYVIISKEEFASYITKVKLTTQNWKQYMDIVERTFVRTSKFGEVGMDLFKAYNIPADNEEGSETG